VEGVTSGRGDMLERGSLWLSPSEPSPGGSGRRVIDAAAGELLGYARWPRVPWWRCWLAPTGRMLEEPDESLMFVWQPPGRLAPGWVFDADGVGVARLTEFDLWSAVAGRLRVRGRRVVGSAGDELADWGPDDGGLLLRFRSRLESQPLLKMAILARALCDAER
jgi:hypothetical protein